MKYERVQDEPRMYVAVFDTGDELFQGLSSMAKDEELNGASFTAIGGLSEVELGWFDWEKKEYQVSVSLNEQVELLSLIGDMADNDGTPQVHAHASIARSDGSVRGGHLRHAIVRPTCEVVITETPEHLRKRVDPEAGIPLIRL